MSGDEMKHAVPLLDFNDAGRCPLCGESNRCARAGARRCDNCWCQTAAIPQGLLEQIPAAARMRACICRCCIDAYNNCRNP